MLIELADAAVDILGDALMAGLKEGLPDCLGQQHVLVGVLLKHPLQEERSPRLLQLSPVLLAGLVELVFIGHVPDYLDVELLHLLSAASVDATVIQEKVELVVVASRCSHLLQERHELLLIEGVVLDLIVEDTMALAYGCTNCLSRLISSTILNNDILVRARPSLLLVASGLEDTLIGKDEVATVADDLVDLVPQLDGLVGIRLVELVLLLRHVLGLHLLELEAIELEDLAVVLWLDDTIGELSMEQLCSLCETQMRLSLHCIRVHKVVLLLVLNSSKGDSLGSM